jgi:valyl-tRNA synthetase
MSKTKGNVIDPLEVTEKYGTDAVRMALLRGAAPGTDIAIGIENFESARAFANKIWNASRLIFMKMESSNVEPWVPRELNCCLPEAIPDSLTVPLEDRWIFSRLNRCAESVNRAVENYRFHEAAQTLWQFVWHEFCDWYLELKKLRFEDNSGLNAHWRNLLTVYEFTLRLLHPLMPFITEELWQRVAHAGGDRPKSVALANYPQYNPQAADPQAEYEMEILQGMVTAARELRADMKLDPKSTMEGVLVVREPARAMVAEQLAGIERIAGAKLDVRQSADGVDGVKRGFPEFDLIVRVSAAQAEAQRLRIQKESEQLQKVIASSERQLGDEKFVSRAPSHVVESIKEKLAGYRAQLEKLQESLQ